MTDKDKLYIFEESHTSGGSVVVLITAGQIVEYMQSKFDYSSEDEAIKDFCTNNWAWPLEERSDINVSGTDKYVILKET